MLIKCLNITGISAYLGSYSGNTLSGPEDPFKNDEPHVLHERLQELSLNDLVFLQKPTKGKNGKLSWEFVSNPYFSKSNHSSALTEYLRSETSRPNFPR